MFFVWLHRKYYLNNDQKSAGFEGVYSIHTLLLWMEFVKKIHVFYMIII